MSSPAIDDVEGDDAVPPARADVRLLSDADLIVRFQVACALKQALLAPRTETGVHAMVAASARHNDAEMLDILDDLVRRVLLRGRAALR